MWLFTIHGVYGTKKLSLHYFTTKVEEIKDDPNVLFRLIRNIMGNSADTILLFHTC